MTSSRNGKIIPLEEYTKKNIYYRDVIHTTDTQQLVVMNIPEGKNIGLEIHPHTTQFFKIEKGRGEVVLGKTVYSVKQGDCIIVNPGIEHDVIARSRGGLRLFTIYSPPEHKPGTKQKSQTETIHKDSPPRGYRRYSVP